MAEFLRIKGELTVARGGEGAAAAAQHHYRQALDWARRQGALAWELRAATSLATLLRDQGHGDEDRGADGSAILRPVYDRFAEGRETADLRAARRVIAG